MLFGYSQPKQLLVVLVLLSMQLAVGTILAQQQKIVQSKNVEFVGYQVANTSVYSFLGIRYGQATAGENRFRATVPFTYDAGTRLNATSFGPVCPQPVTPNTPLSSQSEDCLYLNIWTPQTSQQQALEVLVWIHGGSFTSGAGSMYDGSFWAEQSLQLNVSIIIVTINYRLGSLGFFSDESTGLKGNFGLMDQLEALRWVKSNIAAFGGDPNKVTVDGESAGGMSIACLLTNSAWSTENLFQQAVIQSGIVPSTVLQNTLSGAQAWANILKSRVQCYTLDCLRQVSFEKMISSQVNITFVPVIDNQFRTESVFQNLDKANNPISNISIMIGTTMNETSYFTCGRGSDLNMYQLYILFKTLFNMETSSSVIELLAQVPILYGSSSYSSMLQFFNVFMTDAMFYCPARYYGLSVSDFQSEGRNVHQYVFSYVHELLKNCYGAPHASELPYLFPSILNEIILNNQLSGMFTNVAQQISDRDRQVSNAMIYYWSSFVKFGNPNGNSQTSQTLPDWSPFEHCLEKELLINVPPVVQNAYKQRVCNFWNSQFGFNKSFVKPCTN